MLSGTCHCNSVKWTLGSEPDGATACNCTSCRRYGALWAYGFDGEDVHTSGPTTQYVRGPSIEYHFCLKCGNIAFWRSQQADEDGRKRMGVNLRLADPDSISHLPIDHFDGLSKWEDLPRDGKCVRDLWF